MAAVDIFKWLARSDKKKLLIHGVLTEANKALRFFSEGTVIETFDVFF